MSTPNEGPPLTVDLDGVEMPVGVYAERVGLTLPPNEPVMHRAVDGHVRLEWPEPRPPTTPVARELIVEWVQTINDLVDARARIVELEHELEDAYCMIAAPTWDQDSDR